ncbi:MAG: O-antigen ligase family protein [Saprospiraceae bacterium]|nr:O-antigen ligase family protein [Saprospiraceae bacterium]
MRKSGLADCEGLTQAATLTTVVYFLLLLFLVFSPFYDSIGVPVAQNAIMLMDWHRLTELLVVSLVLIILCTQIWSVRKDFFSLPALQIYGWSAFFIIGAVSCTLTIHSRFAWVEWSWILTCGLVVVLISLQSARDLYSMTAIARLFALAVLASYTPLYYILNSDYLFDSSPVWQPSFVGFYNVRVFSDFQTAVICLLPWALSHVSRSTLIRVVAWCLAGCYVALAFVASSRSLVLGQLVAFGGVFLILGHQYAKSYFYGQLRLWLAGALLYALLFIVFPVIVADPANTLKPISQATLVRFDGSRRVELWYSSIQFAMENPWFGIGPMQFASIINPVAASPHNQIFQVMAEFGIAAAVLFVVLISHWLVAVRRGILSELPVMSADERFCSAAILAAILALFAQSCVSPVFNNPQSQVLLIFLGGMLGGYVKWSAGSVMSSIRRPVFVLASVFALVVFTISCLPWALHLEERNACHFASKNRPTPHLAPRFWQQGWIFEPCEPNF